MRVELPPPLVALSSAEAAARLARIGPNRLVAAERLRWLKEAVRIFADPMALMLLLAAGIYFALGEPGDAYVMLIALVPVLGVDVVLEARSRAALRRLAQAASPPAHVVRDGEARTIPGAEIVPGDVVLLREGDVVHADGVVRTAANLAVDESSLTGESEPQPKSAFAGPAAAAEEASRFFAGSTVSAGQGYGEVLATGPRTRFGDVAALLAATDAAPTPLQKKTGVLVRRLSIAALGVAVAVCVVELVRGRPWSAALMAAVSVAMAAIPEEFPLVFTLFLAVGARRLGRAGVLVRRLASVETLGSTTVVCTDKTGTLTFGRFDLETARPLPGVELRELLEAAVLACEPDPVDAMERAIFTFATERGAAPAAMTAPFTLVRDYDFDPLGKHMSHVWAPRDGGPAMIAAKGALEGVLAHCAPDDAARRAAEDLMAAEAARGMRLLAVASRRLPGASEGRAADESGLRLLGLLGFRDPLRPEVPAAVAELRSAGVRLKMITGDHALTAHAIADAAGIAHDRGAVVTGDAFEAMDPAARAECAQRASVFARVTPAQKFRLVEALQAQGEIVAMTGDGVNDAPALRLADVGVSMGRRGTDVARGAADLVLLEDDLASVVLAVREGRHIYRDLQSAFLYIVAFHLPIVGLALLQPILGRPPLLLPLHLVWLELIVHPVSALIFQGEPPTADLMRRPPRPPAAPLLPARAFRRSVAVGATLTLAVAIVYELRLPSGEAAARGAALATLLVGYQLLVWVERYALNVGQLRFFPRRPLAWVVWILAGASLPLAMAFPAAAARLKVLPLDAVGWLTAAVVGVAAVVWRVALDRARPVSSAG
jgi:Ca2+-transporting ATPase